MKRTAGFDSIPKRSAQEVDGMPALLTLLQTAGPMLEPVHHYSVQDLRLVAKPLWKAWHSAWQGIHSDWASFGGSRILEHFPFFHSPCFGKDFLQHHRFKYYEKRLAKGFIQRVRAAITHRAIGMLAAYLGSLPRSRAQAEKGSLLVQLCPEICYYPFGDIVNPDLRKQMGKLFQLALQRDCVEAFALLLLHFKLEYDIALGIETMKIQFEGLGRVPMRCLDFIVHLNEEPTDWQRQAKAHSDCTGCPFFVPWPHTHIVWCEQALPFAFTDGRPGGYYCSLHKFVDFWNDGHMDTLRTLAVNSFELECIWRLENSIKNFW